MATKAKARTIRIRCWVDIGGEKIFGPGRAELLELIDETGSISKAAQSMGMSYKKAWAMVDEMNTLASKPFVISQKGGQKGGGAELTQSGRNVIKAYNKLMIKINSVVAKESDLLKHI